MHYRLAPHCPGSGQFRTACGQVLGYASSTLDRGLVDCVECEASAVFQQTEQVFGEAELRPLLYSDQSEEPVAACWRTPSGRVWFFWRAPAPAYRNETRWHAVEDMGRFYSSHDTLPAAFANAQRIEQAIIGKA